MYLDGVFIGKNIGAVFDIAELERVEVLRGPQGTLYGKNTVGGAVNLITRKPSGEFGGRVTGEVGNEGYWSGRVSVDTPEIAGIKGTLSFYTEERDGFADNNPDPFGNFLAGEPSSDEFQDTETDAARVALLWDITDSLAVGYTFDYSDVDATPRLGQLTQTSSNSWLYSGGLQDPYITKDDEREENGSNDWAFEEASETESHTLDITWRGDNIALRSLTSYRDLDWDDVIDIDGTAIDIFHSERHIDYDSFSQELQLTGSYDKLDYVVGLYYFEEEADVFNPISFFSFAGVPTGENSYGLDNDSIAAYGQVDWRPGMFDNRMTVTLGVRWTEEEKDQYVVHPGIYDEQADDTFDNTSPAVALSWAFTDDINGYVRYAEGWKSGGFNSEGQTAEEFLNGYKDEEVASYEVGLKSLLLDGRLKLNAAAFYNEFDDYQISVFEGAAAASLVVNIPEYETSGFELEAVALVTENLQFNLAYGYLDTEYKDFPKDFDFFSKNEAGTPYSPENSLTLGMDWTIARTGYGNWDLHVRASQIDDRSLVNARLALSEIELGGGMLQFALWGQNLTDEDYRINTIPFGGVDQRVDPNGGSGVGWTTSYFGEPRTYGVELTYSF
jgi:iron complex outermembrane receptor protein